MFQRILVPVDVADTETAQRTLSVASELAETSEGHLRAVYVRYLLEEVMQYVPAHTLEADEKMATGKLRELLRATKLPDDRVSAVSPCGRAYSEVLAAAADFKADLIVIGPHRPSMAKFLLGTDAGRIVRHAPMSVLVVR